MNNKIVYGLLTLILVVSLAGLFYPKAQPIKLGAEGDTNFTNVVASSNITAGGTLAVTGATTLTGAATLGNATLTGDTRVYGLVNASSTALGSGATTTITAANVCDTVTITVAPSAANSSTTLPTATALAADCMTAQYDYRDITFINAATTAASTTILKAADASTTLLLAQAVGTSTVTLSGGEAMKLRFIRNAATTNWVMITEFTNQ